jgi:Tfp pilus assembly protein PilO
MNDPKRVDILGHIAMLLLVSASAALLTHYIVRPYLATTRDARSFREAVEILSLADGGLDRLNMQLRVIEEGIDEIEVLLPREINVDAFLKELGDLAETAGVRIERLTPAQVTDHDLFRELVLDVHITGSFPAIDEFIVSLEAGKQLSRVSQITISDDGSLERCSARMSLGLYFAPGGRI